MKVLKKDLQSVVKALKSLTKKTERIEKKLDKLAKAKAPKKAKAKPKVKARKAKKKVVTRKIKKKAVKRKAVAKKAKRVPASESVFKIIKRSSKGVRTATLQAKTGFKEKKVRDIIYRLKNQGKIKSAQTGLYVKT
ncbi:MAG: hypothetical protein JRC68_07530 [Deltaproteobacteria bacterium]|nr:hypothetical protein [Deltaproteobacteria bacterium]